MSDQIKAYVLVIIAFAICLGQVGFDLRKIKN